MVPNGLCENHDFFSQTRKKWTYTVHLLMMVTLHGIVHSGKLSQKTWDRYRQTVVTCCCYQTLFSRYHFLNSCLTCMHSIIGVWIWTVRTGGSIINISLIIHFHTGHPVLQCSSLHHQHNTKVISLSICQLCDKQGYHTFVTLKIEDFFGDIPLPLFVFSCTYWSSIKASINAVLYFTDITKY